MTSTAVQVHQGVTPAVNTVVQTLLTSPEAAALLTPLLPQGVGMDRVASEVYFAAQKNPDIINCTPTSIVASVATALRRDLVIGETIHLVPMNESYKDERGNWQKRKVCQAWNDYKGDLELIQRTGVVGRAVARAVYANEHFEYFEGLEPHLVHHPSMDSAERGPIIGAYFLARLKFGYYTVKWMPIGDIEVIRAKSKSWAKEPVCPGWFACKTAIHAGCKELPKGRKIDAVREVLELDDAIDAAPLQLATQSALPAPHRNGVPVEMLEAGDTVDMATGEILEAAVEALDLEPVGVPTLAEALAYILPGKGTSWGGFGGKPLGDCRNTVLRKAAEWAREQLQKEGGFANAAELAMNCDAVLAARVAGTHQEPEKAA